MRQPPCTPTGGHAGGHAGGHGHDGHADGHGHGGHGHGITRDADRGWLVVALALIGTFMLGEVVVGLLAGSLALLSDAAHMLTDAAAIVLALVAMRLAEHPPRGGYTFGLKRAEILSALANGVTLLAFATWLAVEAVHRLIDPPRVHGVAVGVTALVGIVVNLLAVRAIGRANRESLNIRGAYLHILTDLFAFVATAIAGFTVAATGFARADGIAALFVVALMVKAGVDLVRESGRVFLEAAPSGIDPPAIGARIAAMPGVVEVHDLHVWQITSGQPAVSAHVLVAEHHDCHTTRITVERLLHDEIGIHHSTLQVDHVEADHPPVPACASAGTGPGAHCCEPHGEVYR